MDLFVVVYLVYNVILMLSIERMMGVFFEKRRTPFVLFALSFLLYYAVTGFVFLMWNIPVVSLIATVFTYFIITLNYESPMVKRLGAVIYVFSVMAIFGDLLPLIIITGERVAAFEYAGFNSVPVFVTGGLLIYPFSVLSRKFKNIRKHSFKSPLYYASYTLIPLISLVAVIFVFSQTYLTEYAIISITIAIFAINILAVFLLDQLSATYESSLNAAIYANERDSYLAQLHLMQESVDSVKSIRHDMKLQLNTLKDFSVKDNAESVTAYINSLIDEVAQSETYSNTGNIAVDSLINFKLRNAKQDNINLELSLFVPPALEMEVTDLVTILGNLLDNDLEAVAKVEDKTIRLEIKYDIGGLKIVMENSFSGEVKQGKKAAKNVFYP